MIVGRTQLASDPHAEGCAFCLPQLQVNGKPLLTSAEASRQTFNSLGYHPAPDANSPLWARYIPGEVRHSNQLGEKLPDVAIGARSHTIAEPGAADEVLGDDVFQIEGGDSTPPGVMIVDTLQIAGQRV